MRANPTSCREASYVLPDDAITLQANDPRLFTLADRLWDRATGSNAPDAITLAVHVAPSRGAALPRDPLAERWSVQEDGAALSLGGFLGANIDCGRGRADARVADWWLEHDPALVARLLLETPAAMLLARRGFSVVHAGTVKGLAGAVVIRGAPGAGKSTLVAAAHQRGLEVLGDDTVLANRRDPDTLVAAVRDVTLLPDATRLLGLEEAVTPAGNATEPKQRLDLFPSSAPAARRARRVATVVLGARDNGPARLEPLSPAVFLDEFARGAIAQERWSGTPPHIAAHWSRNGAYRLSGARDLARALDLLVGLAGGRA